MSDWTLQRVEQLAPDAAAVKAAHGVSKPAKWQNVGRTGQIVWGQCQGSGAKPYQVRVDIDDVAYKCSCPSRKLPCKHVLGLLLLFAEGGARFKSSDAPAFVVEWIENRAKHAQRVEKKSAPERPPDAAAQARRVEKRERRIETGLDQLEVWLRDLALHGLAAARAQPASFWEHMAARLVDAQAPGLGRRVRELGDLAVSSGEWQEGLLAGLARLQLLIDAYRRHDALPVALAAEVRAAVGWTQGQEAVLGREGIRDHWHVAGQRQTASDRLRTRYTWLIGHESGRLALMLEFAVGREPLPATFATGQLLDGEVVYYDGVPPLRAILKTSRHVGRAADLPRARSAAEIQNEFASLLAQNPCLERWPTVIGAVVPAVREGRCLLVDPEGRVLPLRANFRHGWHLVALSSGEPLSVFGEWDGSTFEPISVSRRGELFAPSALGELAVLAKVA